MLNPKILRLALAAAAAFALAECETVTVRTDSAHDITADHCHTYAFANEHVAGVDQPAAYANPLNAERLKVAIQSNMAARGIQLVDRTQADCVLGYAMGTRQVMDGYYGGYYGAGWGYYGRGWRGYGYWGNDGPWISDETRISVDLFDAESHKPIWHGSASQTTYELSGPEAIQKIDHATAVLFSKFPAGTPAPAAAAAPAPAAT